MRRVRSAKSFLLRPPLGYKAPPDPANRYFDPALGGGSLPDLGIYPVFIALLLLGAPDTIKAVGTLSEEGIDETYPVQWEGHGLYFETEEVLDF